MRLLADDSVKAGVKIQRRFAWPDWFHDAVTANAIITHGMGKFGEGEVFAEVKTPAGVEIARPGDWVTLSDGGALGVLHQ